MNVPPNSAWACLRRAILVQAHMQLALGTFIGQRDTLNPSQDGMRMPTAVLDVKAALRYARENVKELEAMLGAIEDGNV